MHIMDDLQQHIEQLRNDLRYHEYQYHVLDNPVIPDAEYVIE